LVIHIIGGFGLVTKNSQLFIDFDAGRYVQLLFFITGIASASVDCSRNALATPPD